MAAIQSIGTLLHFELGLLLSLGAFVFMFAMAGYLYYCITRLMDAHPGTMGWLHFDTRLPDDQ